MGAWLSNSAPPYDCGIGKRALDLESDELGVEC